MSAERLFARVRYGTLRVGDVFVRANGSAHEAAIVVEEIGPDFDKKRLRIRGHFVGTTDTCFTRFETNQKVMCVRSSS